MALAVRTPRFQPRPASISAPATPASNSLAAAAAANARPRTCAGAAVRASPFTEATSSSRYLRDAWSYATDCSSNSASRSSDAAAAAAALGRRDDEIALQLPELQRLLDALRASRRRGAEGGGGGGRGPGRVALVGTGPGDPELLTLKAVRAIEAADLVLYDRLVSNDVLDLVGEGSRLLYVGKTAGYHSRTQEEIHELLLSFAEAGANVVRLKGGDPLVFGRGGEEMDFLQQQGIKVEIIPGITSASGIAAELGIPLTHRGVATSVRFLTGHSRNGGTDPLYVAGNAADPDTTLVVYMGLSTLASLAPKLMKHGLPPDTPAVAVERGTTPQQRMVFALLKDLVDEVKSADLVSPTLIIIGKVVSLSPFWVESSEHDALKIESSYASEAR
ncbi:Siroheme synthase 2 [Zea mays]|uniref:uroporphyrinogen-III C-methyltransferase n=4 Tax=Zea mays TaxID=4577 RepID=K7VJV9_MAIZE|nr:urophorphyrin methylase 1 [Zea mays]AQK96889.1 urophorphyrin methylase 1 [Zea mays]AQK96890.1 urophorphyrin methylase 1 [Zea mays]AQK96891.1 urophorphyrin methylase 1 [Zea mays]AQK96893.1 urophorphyrin methylase 1 [Zea mays]PWZ09036.1 Siroheme synthase 2 [Zea mays]|eukprot:XP_020397523.1 urophorphyrin methylase 1 isoform X1 [Zea mays]